MIDKDKVRYVARLAHLSLTEPEVDRLAHDLTAILDYVRQLEEVDTSAVEPTAHAVPLATEFREDAARPGIGLERALANAPERLGDGFGVPKIIE
jgi:aspartyl-tRNA(Asn)/glutamyl-tRNA(Gln) amidotransferase subunit C